MNLREILNTVTTSRDFCGRLCFDIVILNLFGICDLEVVTYYITHFEYVLPAI